MQRPVVFISHSSLDIEPARRFAAELEAGDIVVRTDLQLRPGDDFVRFMNDALERSDHCIVLWSKNVDMDSYVGTEISAAFVSAVKIKPAYLLFARLDARPLPALYKARLCVDLVADWPAGVRRLKDSIRKDTDVALATGKPVQPYSVLVSNTSRADSISEIYLCSSIFERTLVVAVDVDQPAATLLEQIIGLLEAPRSVDHAGRFGVRIAYFLNGPSGQLDVSRSLREQCVQDGCVVWLELECEPFIVGKQVPRAATERPRFRRAAFSPGQEQADPALLDALQRTARALETALTNAKLRTSAPIPIGVLKRRATP